MTPTAHARMLAQSLAKEHHPQACLLGVPTGPECLQSMGEVIGIRRHAATHEAIEDAPWECTIDTPIPYDTPGVLVLYYLYRDAGNYKTTKSLAIRGTYTRADLALLIGTLHAGDDASFIPHQVGLQDLQYQNGGDVDFDDLDHVWHTLQALGWRAEGASDLEWETLRPLLLARSTQGYDILSALEHHGA